MAIRLKALFMLLIVGLVLPVAGSPQRFCMRYLTFLAPGECCPAICDENRENCGDVTDPAEPCCIASLKLLPDALTSDPVHPPAPTITPSPMISCPEAVFSDLDFPSSSGLRHGSQLEKPPLYLLNRSLLL